MKSLPKISFVIPLHNRAEMVLDALNSLLDQTISDWEAVVVDDHSTDNPEATVKGFDHRVRLVKLPDSKGRGAAAARNYGNKLAKAELIAVLDSDDWAKPERAERAIKSYNKRKWDFYCAYRETVGVMKGALTTQKVLPTKWDSELFKTQSFVTHSSVVYTKKSALEIKYDQNMVPLEDYDLITRFIVSGKKMFLDPFITTVYRRHDGVTLTSHTKKSYRLKLLHSIRILRGWEQESKRSQI
jgi:glycosyltransferase involved in cell wall biosynthesis